MQERRATSVTRRSFTLIGITMMIRVLGLHANRLFALAALKHAGDACAPSMKADSTFNCVTPIRIKSAILWLRTYHYFLDILQNETKPFSIAAIAGLLLTLLCAHSWSLSANVALFTSRNSLANCS
ncbi:MAG: hypothetical protein QOC96_1736 [Acidobacteriota bacterium]|nr:hypothetical protein [Acidobacteriota bacterium]